MNNQDKMAGDCRFSLQAICSPSSTSDGFAAGIIPQSGTWKALQDRFSPDPL